MIQKPRAPGIPPGAHMNGGGGRDLLRCLYFGFLQAQSRPGTNLEGRQVEYEHVPPVVF